MAIKLTLKEALKEALQDDHRVSKYEAKVIQQLVTSAGHISPSERATLEEALKNDYFDEEAYKLLSALLLRADLKK